MTTSAIQQKLAPLRVQIDELDRQIVELLNRRANIVIEVGKIKHSADSGSTGESAAGNAPAKPPQIYVPEREQQVLAQVRAYNKGPLPDRCLMAIWRELMSGSFALERPLRIGYLGPAGSYSHMAAKLKFGSSVEYDSLDDISGVFEEIVRGHVDLGLVPIENSYIGGIGETLDSFRDNRVHVCGEVLIGIHHNLLSNTPAEEVKKIYSKPEVFSQCRRWLGLQLVHAEKVPVASSSKAAEIAAKEPGSAAIGSILAAETYDLAIQFANIEDDPNNVTRFFIISLNSAKPTGDDKTSLMFTTVHKAGALAEVLNIFRDHGLNLTHIDKRPSKLENWEYVFFIDCLGHQSDPTVASAIEAARKHCLHLTVLGSFPRAKEAL